MRAQDSTRPLFSVVIPTYNRAQILTRALQTLEHQVFRDFEVIVVDDGSTDNTELSYNSRTGLKVRFVRQANGGPSSARNTGRRHATGEFLVFLDDDDEPRREWLALLEAALRTNKGDVGVVCCAVELVDPDGANRELVVPTKLGPAHGSYRALFLPGAYAVRAALCELAGGFCEEIRYGEHHEMFLRVLPICTDRNWQVRATDDVVLTKHHDRRLEVTQRYSAARVHSFEYHLQHHAAALARDGNMLAVYSGVAGVAAVHLGQFGRARAFFLKGWLARPSNPRNLARLLLAMVPPLARWVWRR